MKLVGNLLIWGKLVQKLFRRKGMRRNHIARTCVALFSKHLNNNTMLKLEDIAIDSLIVGLEPDAIVTVLAPRWLGESLQVTYQLPDGTPKTQLLNRSQEEQLSLSKSERPFSFDGDAGQGKCKHPSYIPTYICYLTPAGVV